MKAEYKIPFILSWKHLLRSNKWTLSLIIFFMSIAFINMIFVPSLFNGIVDGFNKQIITTTTGNILITPRDGKDFISDSSETINRIESTDGVTAASAQMLVPGTLKFDGKKGSWSIYAINPDQEKKVTTVSEKIIDGEYLDPSDETGILLGNDITSTETTNEGDNPFSLKGASVGDTVAVIFGNTEYEFTIRGIFKTKFNTADQRGFITQEALKKMNPGYVDEATSISVTINLEGDEENVMQSLKDRGVRENIYSWQQASSLMSSVSDSFLSINVILSIFGVLIAAITVFIVIYIDISSRRQEIGILRAIGIRPYLIRAMYIILSAVYSVAGVLLGTVLFFAIIVPYFNAHPFVLPIADAKLLVNPGDFIARLETLIWVAIAAGLVPAVTITRTKLLDAIWGSK
ncbi:MAG: FtsX-like permease family protein [Patescibacteria group bacterium]|nr:FtsX-like permease family protein [Patescibacteria group bacterium]MDD5715181.1 FtsX-like permease family protein [Patescibacteria group bacterium]